MLAAFLCLQRKLDWAAGAFIALAAAIKAFPILVVGYLVYRRRWRATAYVALFLVLIFLLPVALRGFTRAADDLQTWRHSMLRYDASAIAQRPSRGYNWKNNSLQAVANRLLRPLPADRLKDGRILYVNVADLPFRAVNIVIVAAALGRCLVYVLLTPSNSRRTPRSDALEFAMLLPLILVFTPLSFSYNWTWLIFPITLIIHFILNPSAPARDRKIAAAWLIACMLLFALDLPVPIFRIPRALGNTFWASLLIFAELAWLLRPTRIAASR